MAKLLLTPCNLLVLDEPTNHLDMQSKDILKNALLQFDGTLIVVSHDRDFLQGLTNKVFDFRDRQIHEHLGDIYDFLEYRRLKNLRELEVKNQLNLEKDSSTSDNKISYERKKQLDREIRKLNTQISKSEKRISELEAEIAKHNELLSKPDENLDFNKLSKEYDRLNKELEQEMLSWEEQHEKLEKFSSL